MKLKSVRLTTRNDFSTVFVLSLVQQNEIDIEDARRILEEACHRIVQLENRNSKILRDIETFYEAV